MTQKRLQFAFLLLTHALLEFRALGDGFRSRVVQDFQHADEARPMRLPTAVAIGLAGEVFVLDGVHNRVVVFRSDGTFDSILAPQGSDALNQPIGLRVASDGRLWIADSGNGRIVVCAPGGALERVLAIPAGEGGRRADPADVAVSPDGAAVWVTDNDNHRLLRLDEPANRWQVVGEMGEALGQWQYPFQICAGSNGELLVTDVLNARVQVLAADGRALRSIGTYGVELGQLYRPGGLATDRDRNIWVADSVTGVVQVFRDTGAVVDVLRDDADRPMHFDSPLGLAFDERGALYVVESRAARVRKLLISKSERPGDEPPPPPRDAPTEKQAKSCTLCHLDWMPVFSAGRDSSLMARPVDLRSEPVASRSELCLSCHDGTVADSRRRVWDEHGHQTGVAPSASIKVPAHLPLSEGKLACRTCHSAHASDVPKGDLRRAIMLRVPNTSSELCASCHADKTLGPRFGTHPTRGMPWTVPQPLVDAGSKVGPNPRELTCQVCHTPHGAGFDHLLVMNASSNQLCLTCHDQMRPGMFREGAHAEHPLMVRVNAEQAAAVRDLGTRLSTDGALVCLSCHKLHHGKGGRFLLADELSEGQLCLRCHDQRRAMLGSSHDLRTNHPSERNRLGMTVADAGPCSACHLFHRFAREMTPGAGDAAGQCLTCHRAGACAENKQLGAINHPAVRCTECHDPHQVQFGGFLRERSADLCARCHADKMLLLGGPHDSTSESTAWCNASEKAGDRCLACHRPHGDERNGLFRVAVDDSQDRVDAACFACHENVKPDGALALRHTQTANAVALGAGVPLFDHADGAKKIGCATCHDPHGGAARGQALLRATSTTSGVELCVRCHTDMTQIVVTAHSADALREHGLGSAACGPCHQIHGDSQSIADRLLWPRALLNSDASAGDPYCTSCHRAGGSGPPPVIASHPDVKMFNADASSSAALPLFDVAGAPDAHGQVGCRTCHLPHGRPTPGVSIGATATPEIRAQRPLLRPFEPPNACTTCHSVDALRRFLYFHDPERRAGAGPSMALP